MTPMGPVHFIEIESPLGPILVAGDAKGLVRLSFQRGLTPSTPQDGWLRLLNSNPRHPVAVARDELAEYFAGQRTEFTVPVRPSGTPFQKRVWAALTGIPFGVTISYGELARRVGQPTAARAVGGANGRNSIPIVIPCHRVVRSEGALGGFSYGLDLKERLLALEC
jgi:methylated-DNA-[protein]-cysteine S-methyltransferase